MTDGGKPGGLIAQQQAKIAAVEAEIDDLQSEVSRRIGELARLQGQAERGPTPEVLAEIQATSETVRRLRAQLPAPGREVQPRLGAELEREKAELGRLREQRRALHRTIHEIEEAQRRYGDAAREVLAACQTIRRHLDRAGWPERADNQAVLWLHGWASSIQRDVGNLPGLRARFESFGEDPDGPRLPDYELESIQVARAKFGLVGAGARL